MPLDIEIAFDIAILEPLCHWFVIMTTPEVPHMLKHNHNYTH